MLDRMRRLPQRATLILAIGALLLAQLLFPMQAHSRLERDARGLTVAVCTLSGVRNVRLALPETEPAGPKRSAAMEFSDLLHQVAPVTAALASPSAVLYRVSLPCMARCPDRRATPPRPVARDPPLSG